jgi:DNA topoisomerase IB
MARRGGWKRLGPRGRFRYEDARGKRITDEAALERVASLAIPPAWRDVWISPRAGAKLQATGVDKAGRRQYLYHPDFRARQEQAKFDKLISFAEKLPDLRAAMAEHMELEPLSFEWTAAVVRQTADLRSVELYLKYLIHILAPPQERIRIARCVSFHEHPSIAIGCGNVFGNRPVQRNQTGLGPIG